MPENKGPHPALFPMLLAMSQSGENLEKMLDDMLKMLQSAKEAMQAMRSGVETFHAGMAKIAPQGAPPRPAAWFGGPHPSVKPKADTSPLPEEDAPAPLNAEISPTAKGPEPTN